MARGMYDDSAQNTCKLKEIFFFQIWVFLLMNFANILKYACFKLLFCGDIYTQVRDRCRKEWGMFQVRLADADKTYHSLE